MNLRSLTFILLMQFILAVSPSLNAVALGGKILASGKLKKNTSSLPPSQLISCEDLQTLREERVQKWKGSEINPMVHCAHKKTQFSWEKHLKDLHQIELFYKQYKIDLSLKELNTWMEPQGNFSQWLLIFRNQRQDIKDADDLKLYSWIDRGVLHGFTHAMTKNKNQAPVLKNQNALQAIQGWSSQPEWKNRLIPLLFKASGSYVSVIRFDSERNYLTPFVAKTILFENLRMKLKPSAFNKLINRLELKISFLHELKDQQIPEKDNDTVSIHNGYVYGAPSDLALDYESDVQTSRGIDCSTMVQACLEETAENKLIYDESRLRMTTNDLIRVMQRNTAGMKISQVKFIQDNFDFEELKSEEQLNPGDVFFAKGHIVIFAGYDKIKNEWVPVTYEATGGEHRIVGRFQRHFKTEKGCVRPFLGRAGEKVYLLKPHLSISQIEAKYSKSENKKSNF